MSAGKCWACSSEIAFVRMDNHQVVTVDPEPHPSGQIVATLKTRIGGRRGGATPYGWARFVEHTLTCKPRFQREAS